MRLGAGGSSRLGLGRSARQRHLAKPSETPAVQAPQRRQVHGGARRARRQQRRPRRSKAASSAGITPSMGTTDTSARPCRRPHAPRADGETSSTRERSRSPRRGRPRRLRQAATATMCSRVDEQRDRGHEQRARAGSRAWRTPGPSHRLVGRSQLESRPRRRARRECGSASERSSRAVGRRTREGQRLGQGDQNGGGRRQRDVECVVQRDQKRLPPGRADRPRRRRGNRTCPATMARFTTISSGSGSPRVKASDAGPRTRPIKT